MSDKFEEAYNAYKQDAEARAEQEAMNSVDEGKEQIVAVRKNEDGDIIAVKTNSGRELDYPTAIQEAKVGKLQHVDVFQKYGRDILRSEPDGILSNNLDNLETF